MYLVDNIDQMNQLFNKSKRYFLLFIKVFERSNNFVVIYWRQKKNSSLVLERDIWSEK